MRRVSYHPDQRIARRQGLSLIDAMVAVALVSVGLVGASAMFTHSITSMSYAHHKTLASQCAQGELEQLRTTGFDNLPVGTFSGVKLISAEATPTYSLTMAVAAPDGCAPVDSVVEPSDEPAMDVETTVAPYPDPQSADQVLCTVVVGWEGGAGSAGQVEMATVISRQ